MPTISEIVVNIAPISQYLVSNDIANGALFGARINPYLPVQLYVVGKSVKYRYDYEDIAHGNEPSTSLVNTANYLYQLCDKYGLYALSLVDAGGVIPGTVTPGEGGTVKLPFIGIAGRGQADDPGVGDSVVQSDLLVGLGSTNGGYIKIFVNTVGMDNFGNNPNFIYYPLTGEIDISPLTFAVDDSIYVDRNQ